MSSHGLSDRLLACWRGLRAERLRQVPMSRPLISRALLTLTLLLGSLAGCRERPAGNAEPVAAEVAGGKFSQPDGGKARTGNGKSGKLQAGEDKSDEFRPVEVLGDEPTGEIWFRDELAGSGIDFTHVSGNDENKAFPAANGSGMGALDYDLDGRADLYFATGTTFPLDYSRVDPANRCYRNLGDWKFADVTNQTGLRHNGYSAGVAVGDYDADGFPDVYVSCFGPNVLFHNLGDGTFERVETTAGVDDERWGASAAWLDYDDDGLLDLYVCNYAKWSFDRNPFCGDRARNIRMHCGPRTVEAEPHLLYHNQGDGTFDNRLREAGISERPGRGQGVVAADINQDGRVDLYVGNDLHANFLFINEGGGKFRDATETSGAAYDANGSPQASMGVDIADVDRDGWPDIFTTNFQLEYNAYYRNLGHDFFVDSSDRMGVVSDSLPFIGWGTRFADFDLDGWFDLVVVNGHVDDNRRLFKENAPYHQPAFLYRFQGERMIRVGADAGEYFRRRHVGRGLVLSDLDNDGAYDLVMGHQDAPPALLRNVLRESRAAREAGQTTSISLRLVGRVGNRDAIGALIECQSALGTIYQQVQGGGSYLSASDLRQIIAVPSGAQSAEIRVQVRWPGGMRTPLTGLEPGGRYVVVEPPADKESEIRIRKW
jgi:hypothetical protein